MKTFKLFRIMLIACIACINFTSCEDEPVDAATAIQGRYAGELISGGSIVEDRCFITVERYSSSDVRITLESDNYNLNPIIVQVTDYGEFYRLSSSSYDISGTIKGNTLNFFYSSGEYGYSFIGEKQ